MEQLWKNPLIGFIVMIRGALDMSVFGACDNFLTCLLAQLKPAHSASHKIFISQVLI